MDKNKILNADVLDIIFEGRNKDYGAYELRKTYGKRLRIAIIGMLSVCLLFFLGSFVANSVKKKAVKMEVQDISLENIKAKEEKKNEPPPPPPPPKQQPPKVEMAKFTPPKIVKDEEVKEPPPPVEKLQETKIGTVNQEGIKDNNIVAAPVVTAAPVVQAPKQEEDYDKIFTVVQIPASFPGGQEAWQRYLTRNLNADIATQNGAPSGNYTVVVTFIVDKQGNISDVQAENDPGYGTKDEAIRVIKRGPAWVPAVQNGRNVICRHRQSITFRIADEQ